MFSILSEGLQTDGPKSVMIATAEKPQTAEKELRDLKMGLAAFGLIVCTLFFVGLFFYFRSSKAATPDLRPDFESKRAALKEEIMLAGPPQFGTQQQHPAQPVQQTVQEPHQMLKVVAKVDEDTIKIEGHIPIWGLDEKDIVETKVSESDENIAAMIRERERISKSLSGEL